MNGTTHTVMQLGIEFRKHLRNRDTCFGFSSNSSVLYDVPNDEHLNGLVLRQASSSVYVANWLYTAAVLCSITVVFLLVCFWVLFVCFFILEPRSKGELVCFVFC